MSRIEDPGSSRQFRTEFCVCECEWEHQGDARLGRGIFSCIAWRINRKKTNNWGFLPLSFKNDISYSLHSSFIWGWADWQHQADPGAEAGPGPRSGQTTDQQLQGGHRGQAGAGPSVCKLRYLSNVWSQSVNLSHHFIYHDLLHKKCYLSENIALGSNWWKLKIKLRLKVSIKRKTTFWILSLFFSQKVQSSSRSFRSPLLFCYLGFMIKLCKILSTQESFKLISDTQIIKF